MTGCSGPQLARVHPVWGTSRLLLESRGYSLLNPASKQAGRPARAEVDRGRVVLDGHGRNEAGALQGVSRHERGDGQVVEQLVGVGQTGFSQTFTTPPQIVPPPPNLPKVDAPQTFGSNTPSAISGGINTNCDI